MSSRSVGLGNRAEGSCVFFVPAMNLGLREGDTRAVEIHNLDGRPHATEEAW